MVWFRGLKVMAAPVGPTMGAVVTGRRESLFWRNWQEQGCREQDSRLVQKLSRFVRFAGATHQPVRLHQHAIVTRLRPQ